MARIVSFVVLIVISLLVIGTFVAIMAQFLLPMFLAVLLVVLFRPLHRWILERCHGRPHLAAGLTTAAIFLIVLVPLILLFGRAASEGVSLAQHTDQQKFQDMLTQRGGHLMEKVRAYAEHVGVELPPNREIISNLRTNLEAWIAPAALRTTQFLGNFLLGLVIMLVSLYFFLADGPIMIDAAMRLSPLEDRYERQLLDEFVRVSRAVVLATLLSALAQGIIAGIGYLAAGIPSVFLLTAMTMFLALVPFVGAAAVWVPCSLWLYFFEGRPVAAILLFLWGVLAVSFIDNVIKPLVLHGQSNIHPLLGLLSVLGGIQVLGPIGIFVGPMVVAFLQALLNILRTELESLERKEVLEPSG